MPMTRAESNRLIRQATQQSLPDSVSRKERIWMRLEILRGIDDALAKPGAYNRFDMPHLLNERDRVAKMLGHPDHPFAAVLVERIKALGLTTSKE